MSQTSKVPEDLCPDELTKFVAKAYSIDVEAFPDFVRSRFGQEVSLMRKDGKWRDTIYVEHLGYRSVKIPWKESFNEHPLLEWAFRTWMIERMELRIDLSPAIHLAKQLRSFQMPSTKESTKNIDALFNWALEISLRGATEKDPDSVVGIRLFYAWCVEEGLPFFDERKMSLLWEIGLPTHGSEHLVSLLDPIDGPHSIDELRQIESALELDPKLIRERALYYLCRDWGLRPIQLALLREADIGTDEVGSFVEVPSVKGVKRAALRRHKTNLKRRHISPETANALRALVKFNKPLIVQIRKSIVQKNKGLANAVEELPSPLFPSLRSRQRLARFLGDDALREYTLHCDSNFISHLMRSLTDRLAIPRSRGNNGRNREDVLPLLEINCYRLRRTKGTSMVLNGASPDEVAEALDHTSTDSISHYFKFNRDLILYVDAAHSASREIAAAVEQWSGKLLVRTEGTEKEGPKVSGLGVCKRDSPCPYHPTVTCYACQSFRPYLDANHEGARDSIQDLRVGIGEKSTGPVKRQLDEAYIGAQAVIEAVKNARKSPQQ